MSYNGVTLPYAQSTSFRQEAVYEDVGGVDRILSKFDIQVQCYINNAYLAKMAADLADGVNLHGPADIITAIRERLMVPRKRLSYTIRNPPGTVDLIPEKAGVDGEVDAKNGPQPQSCTYQQLTEESFILIYHVIGHYWEKPRVQAGTLPMVKENQKGFPVLYNRWTEQVEYDRCMFTTRTRTGKYGIRSDNAEGLTADDDLLRGINILGVPHGFQRTYARYAVAPDGLAIEYKITDKEVMRYPPTPALDWKGRYTESVGMLGAIRIADAFVVLKGAKNVDQARLMEVACSLVTKKVSVAGAPLIGGPKEVGQLLHFSMTSHFEDNVVEARLQVRFKSHKRKIDGVAGLRATVTNVPYTDPPEEEPKWFDRGTAGVVLQAAAYYDPNIGAFLDQNTGQLTHGREIGTAGENPEA